MDELVFSIGSLAARFHLSVNWLKRQVEAGTIPCLRVGRRRIFSIRAVEHAIEQMAGGQHSSSDSPTDVAHTDEVVVHGRQSSAKDGAP